jgi:hypothetical protein
MFNRFKRHSSKTISAQCPRVVRERKVVLCDWGFHGRASNDGWCFTYVDEVDLNPDEDIDCYKQTSLDQCGEILVKFVASQLRKNSRLKESKGWSVLPSFSVIPVSFLTINQEIRLLDRRWQKPTCTSSATGSDAQDDVVV